MPFDQAAIREAVMASLRGEEPQQQTQAAPPKDTHVGAWPYVAAVAGPMADLGTTLDAFSRGAVEGNSIYGSERPTTPLMISKAAQAILVPLLMHKLASGGHPGAAKALGYITGGMGAGLAAHNLTVNR
jgi:hypothetical protein